MAQELAAAEAARAPVSAGKWVPGLSGRDSVRTVGQRVLDARLAAVWHWLPLAAEKCDEDREYVHQLRVATRRAVQAVRIFGDLLPEEETRALRDWLRRIRKAADGARNWDVLRGWFLAGDSGHPALAGLLEWMREQRTAAQGPVVTTWTELRSAAVAARFGRVVAGLQALTGRRARREFREQATRYLRPVVKRFFGAAEQDLSDPPRLHELRIRAKKLRYTMEIVACAFAPAFRDKLYPRISALQDILGTVNDHVMAAPMLRAWLDVAKDAEHRAFLDGWLRAESRAHHDLLAAFLAGWTPAAIAGLRRRFRRYGRAG